MISHFPRSQPALDHSFWGCPFQLLSGGPGRWQHSNSKGTVTFRKLFWGKCSPRLLSNLLGPPLWPCPPPAEVPVAAELESLSASPPPEGPSSLHSHGSAAGSCIWEKTSFRSQPRLQFSVVNALWLTTWIYGFTELKFLCSCPPPKSISEKWTSGEVYDYGYREFTLEQVGLDLQREIEMKILDMTYLNEYVDIYSPLLPDRSGWCLLALGQDVLLGRLHSFRNYLVSRRISHIIKSFEMVQKSN